MSPASPHDLPELAPERDDFGRYLEDTIVVDWQTQSVLDKARELCAPFESETERARVLFEFVRDEIANSLDIETDVVTCNASVVLREKTGLSYAKSTLLVALLRARGIPAGFCYQRLRATPPARGHALHGFVAAYLHDPERWILLDPRGDHGAVRTVFSLDSPSLAYLADPDEGEQTYPSIFIKPAKRIVDMLDKVDSLARIRDRLPSEL
jgi:transglutaminase-like putative cysteine protease